MVDVSCSTLSCATDKFNEFSLFLACNQKVDISTFLHLVRLFACRFECQFATSGQDEFQTLHGIEQALQLCNIRCTTFMHNFSRVQNSVY